MKRSGFYWQQAQVRSNQTLEVRPYAARLRRIDCGGALLTPSASLWTLDKNLGALATRFRIDWGAAHRVN